MKFRIARLNGRRRTKSDFNDFICQYQRFSKFLNTFLVFKDIYESWSLFITYFGKKTEEIMISEGFRSAPFRSSRYWPRRWQRIVHSRLAPNPPTDWRLLGNRSILVDFDFFVKHQIYNSSEYNYFHICHRPKWRLVNPHLSQCLVHGLVRAMTSRRFSRINNTKIAFSTQFSVQYMTAHLQSVFDILEQLVNGNYFFRN